MVSEAVAVLAPKAGGDKVSGTILLKQEKGYVQVTGEVNGPDARQARLSHSHVRRPAIAGRHVGWRTLQSPRPPARRTRIKERHEGDLGNIEANAEGQATVNVKAHGLSLHHVLGRSVVVHAKADDLKSQPAGDAGPRIAVGVIGLAEPPKK